MYLYRNSINYEHRSEFGDTEPVDPVSMTVPDLSLSVSEIMDRYTRGLPLPSYEESWSEDDFPDFASMDLVELEAYREELAQQINFVQEESRLAALAQSKKELELAGNQSVEESSDDAEL